MLAYASTIVVCPHNTWAALTLKCLSLQFLTYLLVQGLEFILRYLSATRTNHKLFVVLFLASPAEDVPAFGAHDGFKKVLGTNWAGEVLNQHLVYSMNILKSFGQHSFDAQLVQSCFDLRCQSIGLVKFSHTFLNTQHKLKFD